MLIFGYLLEHTLSVFYRISGHLTSISKRRPLFGRQWIAFDRDAPTRRRVGREASGREVLSYRGGDGSVYSL